jgi:signal transduction histidine kinase
MRRARVVIVVVVFDVLLLVPALAAIPLVAHYQPGGYGSMSSSLFLVAGTVVQLGVAALVSFRRPEHPVGWLLLASVTASLVDSGFMQPYAIYSIDVVHRSIPGGDLVGTVEQMMWIPFVVPLAILLPLVFPSGRLLSRAWRPVVWIAVAAMAMAFVGGSFAPVQDATTLIPGIRPVTLPGPLAAIAGVLKMTLFALVPCVLAGVVALALRYRRGSADERHQVKWLMAAVTIYLLGFFFSLALGPRYTWLQDLAVVGLALIPIAAAVAVFKYRLYDIDIVISRALVYTSLALFITGVYVAIVVGVGALVGSAGRPNIVLSIVATAVVAVAFQPAREAVQRVANRLVYGRRATPYEVLSEFSTRVAESYAGEEVLARMARVLAEGTGAQAARVWLRAGDLLQPAASWPLVAEPAGGPEVLPLVGQLLPEVPGADRAVAVRHQGQLLGALSVKKRVGESLTPIEEKLLEDLAHQAGLVLKNVGLTADLQARVEDLRASRQRLVKAQDDERRRLERNLHDGAQQHLVAIKVKLGLAQRLLVSDPARGAEALHALKADADEALQTLRDLARGIYPPLLAEKGLSAALEAQARKATLPVEVETAGLGRYPQEVEAAIYFCILEALQNVQKYAGASRALVRVQDDGGLSFEVEDDGQGFDLSRTKRGTGLANMQDRVDALGGELTLSSVTGVGSRVSGKLPVVAVGVAQAS